MIRLVEFLTPVLALMTIPLSMLFYREPERVPVVATQRRSPSPLRRHAG